jgi:hypothetical protein
MLMIDFWEARLDHETSVWIKLLAAPTLTDAQRVFAGSCMGDLSAKWAIARAYRQAATDAHRGSEDRFVTGLFSGLEITVQHLAAVYEDHPDYQAGWHWQQEIA